MRSIATENDTEEEIVTNTAQRGAAFPQETILRRQIMTIGKRSDMVAKYLFFKIYFKEATERRFNTSTDARQSRKSG